ncbi:MAG: PilZ domain-containing protein [Terriglobia bacterium]
MGEQPESARPPVTTARGSIREIERRRSERLLLSVPIRVEGVDRDGGKFFEDTRTMVINREGARIYLKRPVLAGTTLAVTTQVGRRTARFRVVGPTQPKTGEGGEWGIECLEGNANLWGIEFPPAGWKEGMCLALIECKRCHTTKLSPLSLVEHEVLGISGLLVKDCEPCGRSTSWGYNELPTAIQGAPFPNPEALVPPGADGAPHRINNRVALQLPIRVRNYYGAEEVTRSENVSRGGMCFVTEKTYEIGEILLITCPYEKAGENIEMRGRVVRRQEMQGTGRKVYGICYER